METKIHPLTTEEAFDKENAKRKRIEQQLFTIQLSLSAGRNDPSYLQQCVSLPILRTLLLSTFLNINKSAFF